MLLTSFTLFSPVLVLFVMGYLIVRSSYLSSHVGDILIEYLMKVPIPIVTFFAMTKFVLEDVAGSLPFAHLHGDSFSLSFWQPLVTHTAWLPKEPLSNDCVLYFFS